MEAIVFTIFQIFFHNTCSFENVGVLLGYPPILAGHTELQPRNALRLLACEQNYLRDYECFTG